MMRVRMIVGIVAACAGGAGAANVYMLTSGDPVTDDAARQALITRGHTVTVGVAYTAFDGTQSLAGYDTVYLQMSYNWAQGDMPAAGQQALVTWVNGGGRLVTSEWVVWKTGTNQLTILSPILPEAGTTSYTGTTDATYTQATPNAALNAGLPAQFTFPVTYIGGTETLVVETRPGAVVYYNSASGAGVIGLAGWQVGAGSVFSFSTTCGATQTADFNFGRLLANAMGAGATGGCYANCDGSTTAPVLNVLDFNCFLNRFSAGNPYANCDGSTTAPVLNVLDFNCFLNRFSAGCP
jgi:hypothetical protein